LAVAVDQACLLLLRETPGKLAVTLSNPRNEPLRVAVTIDIGDHTLREAVELPQGVDAGKSVTTVFSTGPAD
jgi:hypothetical protein